jgi:hypothetical protein
MNAAGSWVSWLSSGGEAVLVPTSFPRTFTTEPSYVCIILFIYKVRKRFSGETREKPAYSPGLKPDNLRLVGIIARFKIALLCCWYCSAAPSVIASSLLISSPLRAILILILFSSYASGLLETSFFANQDHLPLNEKPAPFQGRA